MELNKRLRLRKANPRVVQSHPVGFSARDVKVDANSGDYLFSFQRIRIWYATCKRGTAQTGGVSSEVSSPGVFRLCARRRRWEQVFTKRGGPAKAELHARRGPIPATAAERGTAASSTKLVTRHLLRLACSAIAGSSLRARTCTWKVRSLTGCTVCVTEG